MYNMLLYVVLRLVSCIRKELVDLLAESGYRSVYSLEEEGGEGAATDVGKWEDRGGDCRIVNGLPDWQLH